MRSPEYWKSYHASIANGKQQVFRHCQKVVNLLGRPWQVSKRGSPPKHMPEEYAAVAIYRKYFNMVFRAAEADTPFILGKRLDHSNIWWGLQRISARYLKRAIELLFRLISGIFPPDIFIADSTGISTDRYTRYRGPRLRPTDKPPPNEPKRRKNGQSGERVLKTLKLHALVGYHIKFGLLMARSALITKSEVNDSPQLKELLKGVRGNGESLLLDRGYDSVRNYELGRRCGFNPVIKLRDVGPRGLVRREMAKTFTKNRKLYRRRGLIEGVFGGLETKYGNRTRCRRPKSQRIDCLLMVVSHNLRTYMRALALRKLEIFILVWIY
ncbi:MAG: transposase [Candidatus Hadarchaeales archaeon]